MRRAGFTLLELLIAVAILGVMSTFAFLTFNAVTTGWTVSAEYMDKMQRCDYAVNQVVAGLRSMYYPHGGEQSYDYGFTLYDGGSGKDPRSSDTIEWSKTGYAIVGSGDATADTVHRVQVMVLEEGDRRFKEEIAATGLYARMCPDRQLLVREERNTDKVDFSFANDDLYQPVLVADGVVGFNCRVLKSADDASSETGKAKFEDEWAESNAVPYKVELSFMVADPEGRSYRSNTAPMMRIVRIPVHEQSLDAATLPGGDEDGKSGGGGKKK